VNHNSEYHLIEKYKLEGALKYLKNNKAAGADSIAAELLKNGGPNLVDALREVIQQAWGIVSSVQKGRKTRL
jgi:hypothetical protein